ncbi:MAG: S9 family peptidase, partial [Anaerolineae bacterium]|nr:S9 family peptidase [Anaerolineae bacterium]
MTKIIYPITQRCDQVDDFHGTRVPDPYRWLEDLDAPETRAWIEAQNALTFAHLDTLVARDAIRERLTGLWDYPKVSAPFKQGGRYFQFRNTGLQNQDVLYVMDTPDEEGRNLLDPNTFSEDGTIALTGTVVSWDGAWLAYATSASGSDWKTWRVRNVATGEDLPDVIEWSKFSLAAWLPDNHGFFYGRYPAPEDGQTYAGANYNQQVYLHDLNTDQAEDVLTYERPDHKEWGYDVQVTEDGAYFLLYVSQGTDRRNRFFYRAFGQDEMVELIPDLEAGYTFIGNTGTEFYFRTDLDAPRGHVIVIDVANPARENRRTVIPETEDALESVTLVHDEFVASYLHDAHHQLKCFALDGTFLGEIALPTLGSLLSLHGHREDDELFYSFNSFLYPPTVYRYDFRQGESEKLTAPEIDFDASTYETEQVFVTSKDGTRIPMFLVHRRDWEQDGQNPTLLYGYGGFNISYLPAFSVPRLVWLEMG